MQVITSPLRKQNKTTITKLVALYLKLTWSNLKYSNLKLKPPKYPNHTRLLPWGFYNPSSISDSSLRDTDNTMTCDKIYSFPFTSLQQTKQFSKPPSASLRLWPDQHKFLSETIVFVYENEKYTSLTISIFCQSDIFFTATFSLGPTCYWSDGLFTLKPSVNL